MKKCCGNCKYIRKTFGFNAKEREKRWECTALLAIDPYYTSQSVSKNFVCDMYNKSFNEIKKEFEEIIKTPKYEYIKCLSKINNIKLIK